MCVYVYVHVSICVCVRECVCACICACVRVYVHVHVYAQVHVHVHIYINIYVCVHVCVCTSIAIPYELQFLKSPFCRLQCLRCKRDLQAAGRHDVGRINVVRHGMRPAEAAHKFDKDIHGRAVFSNRVQEQAGVDVKHTVHEDHVCPIIHDLRGRADARPDRWAEHHAVRHQLPAQARFELRDLSRRCCLEPCDKGGQHGRRCGTELVRV